jgi:mannose-6-phosphate isomerase-like protein (cupin superfamily)
MNKTTFVKNRKDMPRQPLENCHGGNGALDWIVVLDGEELKERGLNFVHDDILPPGVSIGVHPHTGDEEYYYIISGKGVMTLNQERIEVAAGDITAVFPGGVHGLENTGDEDLRIIVIGVKVNPNK